MIDNTIKVQIKGAVMAFEVGRMYYIKPFSDIHWLLAVCEPDELFKVVGDNDKYYQGGAVEVFGPLPGPVKEWHDVRCLMDENRSLMREIEGFKARIAECLAAIGKMDKDKKSMLSSLAFDSLVASEASKRERVKTRENNQLTTENKHLRESLEKVLLKGFAAGIEVGKGLK